MMGSRFGSGSGMGFIPILIAAATIGAGIYQQKQQEKAAEDQAKAAEKSAAALAARQRRAVTASSGVPTWAWVAGGVAVLGVGAYVFSRRHR